MAPTELPAATIPKTMPSDAAGTTSTTNALIFVNHAKCAKTISRRIPPGWNRSGLGFQSPCGNMTALITG